MRKKLQVAPVRSRAETRFHLQGTWADAGAFPSGPGRVNYYFKDSFSHRHFYFDVRLLSSRSYIEFHG